MLLSPVLLIAAAAAAPALAFPTLPVAAPAPTAVEDWTTHFELMEETALKVDPTDWCLDNTDWVEQEKARAQTWYYHGGANQRWWVWQRTGNAEGVHEGTATFRLQRKNTDLCLHFYHDSESRVYARARQVSSDTDGRRDPPGLGAAQRNGPAAGRVRGRDRVLLGQQEHLRVPRQ